MRLAWVIGSGGLLGGSLVCELAKEGVELFAPPIQIHWGDRSFIARQFQMAVKAFSIQAKNRPWQIYWAAGAGTMHSTEADLQQETATVDALVSALLQEDSLDLAMGTLVFASSAGAIYAGVTSGTIGESTLVAPINAYGRNKLLQEGIVRRLHREGAGASVVCCRISTIYGAKQKRGKQQGLLTEIARRILCNEVIHIYVPLETMRDYIEVDFAAKAMVQSAAALSIRRGVHVKIIASEVSVSVAQILSIFKAVCKRNLRIVTRTDVRSKQYLRAVQYRSEIPLFDLTSTRENLGVGIMRILAAQRLEIAKHGRR